MDHSSRASGTLSHSPGQEDPPPPKICHSRGGGGSHTHPSIY